MDLNYEDPDPPMVNTNDCGCPIPASPRRAAGCVRVQDTQFAGQAGEFPGVRCVRVIGVNKLYPAPMANLIPSDAPDLFINVWDTWPSDSLKAIAYHELGHAGHYAQVGEAQWLLYRRHIIANVGYSNIILGEANFHPTLSAPGIVALGEAWGEFTESYLTDLAYGINHSNGGNPFDERTIFVRRYINLNERCISPTPLNNPCNQFIEGFIPYGLIWDLVDDNSTDYRPLYPTGFEQLEVSDNVMGYSIHTLFTHLTASTLSLNQYKANISTDIPSGVTQNQIDALFTSYE